MKLEQAVGYFNTVPLEGFTNGVWSDLGVKITSQVYSRFISRQVFGQAQRIFLADTNNKIPFGVQLVRTPELRVYMLLSFNVDQNAGGIYGYSYTAQEARHQVDVIKTITAPAPSGIPGAAQDVVTASTYCDLERFSAESLREADAANFIKYSIVLPKGVVVDTDSKLSIEGNMYDIKEVSPHLDAQMIRASKHGDG